eukprot:5825543-Alexandrium_andersonii.AAC.1
MPGHRNSTKQPMDGSAGQCKPRQGRPDKRAGVQMPGHANSTPVCLGSKSALLPCMGGWLVA